MSPSRISTATSLSTAMAEIAAVVIAADAVGGRAAAVAGVADAVVMAAAVVVVAAEEEAGRAVVAVTSLPDQLILKVRWPECEFWPSVLFA